MRCFTFFICTKCLKSNVYFIPTMHLNFDTKFLSEVLFLYLDFIKFS